MVGWTQQEIAAHPDITVIQSAISEITKKFDTEQICNHFYVSHKEVDKIAEMFDIDEQTAWAILLGGTLLMLAKTGVNYNSLHSYQTVAKAYTLDIRISSLGFKYHQIAALLDDRKRKAKKVFHWWNT
ncbi:hypothetical protein M1N92_05080 [Dehalococcoidia bacterium]|nr:hypothetical protein [Dehalococcoidia bacterium]